MHCSLPFEMRRSMRCFRRSKIPGTQETTKRKCRSGHLSDNHINHRKVGYQAKCRGAFLPFPLSFFFSKFKERIKDIRRTRPVHLFSPLCSVKREEGISGWICKNVLVPRVIRLEKGEEFWRSQISVIIIIFTFVAVMGRELKMTLLGPLCKFFS